MAGRSQSENFPFFIFFPFKAKSWGVPVGDHKVCLWHPIPNPPHPPHPPSRDEAGAHIRYPRILGYNLNGNDLQKGPPPLGEDGKGDSNCVGFCSLFFSFCFFPIPAFASAPLPSLSISIARRPNRGRFLIFQLKMKDIISRTAPLGSLAGRYDKRGVLEEAPGILIAPTAPTTSTRQHPKDPTPRTAFGAAPGPTTEGNPESFLETKCGVFSDELEIKMDYFLFPVVGRELGATGGNVTWQGPANPWAPGPPWSWVTSRSPTRLRIPSITISFEERTWEPQTAGRIRKLISRFPQRGGGRYLHPLQLAEKMHQGPRLHQSEVRTQPAPKADHRFHLEMAKCATRRWSPNFHPPSVVKQADSGARCAAPSAAALCSRHRGRRSSPISRSLSVALGLL